MVGNVGVLPNSTCVHQNQSDPLHAKNCNHTATSRKRCAARVEAVYLSGARQQRPVGEVSVARHPAAVRCAPEHVARLRPQQNQLVN